MKIVYTNAAQGELNDFIAQQRRTLERLVAERKTVFGDDVLEITASDVKDAAYRIRPLQTSTKPYQLSRLVTRVYVGLGLAMMVGAFFYTDIKAMLASGQPQVMLFFTGAAVTFVGWIFGYWLNMRQRRYAMVKRYIESEKLAAFEEEVKALDAEIKKTLEK